MKRKSKKINSGYMPYTAPAEVGENIAVFQADQLYPLSEMLANFQNHIGLQAQYLHKENQNLPELGITQHLQVLDMLNALTVTMESLDEQLSGLWRIVDQKINK